MIDLNFHNIIPVCDFVLSSVCAHLCVLITTFIKWGHVHTTEGRKQSIGVGSHFVLCEFQGLKSSHQAW